MSQQKERISKEQPQEQQKAHRQRIADKQIERVTFIGAIVNVSLATVKITAGLLFGSAAVVTDGLHSLSDLFTDIAVVVGVRLSNRQPDECHPYGHKWYESIATIIISFLLILTGVIAIYSSMGRGSAIKKGAPELILIAIATGSILLKEALYRSTKKIARQTNSSALYANAWHHRSDALSSLAVLVGLAAYRFGFQYGDQAASIVVGTLIIAAGFKLLTTVLKEFTNASIDAKTLAVVTRIVDANKAIAQMHKLRSRSIGREIFLDFHILLDPNLSVREAHKIATEIELQIEEAINVPVNIIIHIEPDEPAQRL